LVDKVTKKISDKRVMALLSGGGYAQYAKVHKNHIMEIPNNLDFIQVIHLIYLGCSNSRSMANCISIN